MLAVLHATNGMQVGFSMTKGSMIEVWDSSPHLKSSLRSLPSDCRRPPKTLTGPRPGGSVGSFARDASALL